MFWPIIYSSIVVVCMGWPASAEADRGQYFRQTDGRIVRIETRPGLISPLPVQMIWIGDEIPGRPGFARFVVDGERYLIEAAGQRRPLAVAQQTIEKPFASGLIIANTSSLAREAHVVPGRRVPFLVKIAKALAIDSIFRWYQRENPDLRPFQGHPEYLSRSHFAVYDDADFEFYQKNKSSLVIYNKSHDVHSETEAYLKFQAYRYSLEEKVHKFDQEVANEFINSLGIYSLRVGPYWFGEVDAALWTGMYLMSQSMRHSVTGEIQALENMKRALRGLFLLMDVPQDSREFARSVSPVSENHVTAGNWQQGTGPYANIKWLPGGNNDMMRGLIIGFLSAYRSLPQNDELRRELEQKMFRLIELRLSQKSTGSNRMFALGFRALITGNEQDYVDYINEYIANPQLQDFFGLGHGFLFEGIADWSGVHLSAVGTISQILLARELSRVFNYPVYEWSSGEARETRSSAKMIAREQTENLWRQYETFRHARRDFLCIFAHNARGMRVPQECLRGLHEILYEVPAGSLAFDNRLRSGFVMSPSPRLPWKSVGSQRKPFDFHEQANRAYPFVEGLAFTSNYLWKEEGFPIHGSKSEGLKMPRVDYLWSYWGYRLGRL